jgi:hypothetical protein
MVVESFNNAVITKVVVAVGIIAMAAVGEILKRSVIKFFIILL